MSTPPLTSTPVQTRIEPASHSPKPGCSPLSRDECDIFLAKFDKIEEYLDDVDSSIENKLLAHWQPRLSSFGLYNGELAQAIQMVGRLAERANTFVERSSRTPAEKDKARQLIKGSSHNIRDALSTNCNEQAGIVESRRSKILNALNSMETTLREIFGIRIDSTGLNAWPHLRFGAKRLLEDETSNR